MTVDGVTAVITPVARRMANVFEVEVVEMVPPGTTR